MNESDERLYVLIPCLNEEANVRGAAESVLHVADELPVDLRVILIDDGSTDRTRAIMEDLCREHPDRCEMIVNPTNLGLGRSVMNTYERIPSGSWVHVTPGDNEFDFAASIGNYLAVRDRYDVILGYLHNPVIRTLNRRLASYAFSKVVATLYGFPYRYLNGFKVYRVDAFRGIEVVSSGHAFVAELLAKALLRQRNLRIGEVPFVARGRAGGQSKAIRPGSVLRAVSEVFKGARSVARYRETIVRMQVEAERGVPSPSATAPPSAGALRAPSTRSQPEGSASSPDRGRTGSEAPSRQ